jgi:hypothetical protein
MRVYTLIAPDHYEQETRQIRAAGVHLIYQTALWAIPFAIYASWTGSAWQIVIFWSITIIFLWAAFGLDARFEDEELLLLKNRLKKLDESAKLFELSKKD